MESGDPLTQSEKLAGAIAVASDLHIYPITVGDKLIMGKGTENTKVTVKLPNNANGGKQVSVNGGGYWFYQLPNGTVLTPGQVVTVTDSERHEKSMKVGKKTEVDQPVEGQDIVTGTGEPGTYLTVAVRGKSKTTIILSISLSILLLIVKENGLLLLSLVWELGIR
ncbi:hypothetical protein [Arcanobacterium hippocoleae]|uniref:hypothetical protein n=1 Tax=Arcanobacterium hippocoleae TaxID=149017 RepID=UPI00334263D4